MELAPYMEDGLLSPTKIAAAFGSTIDDLARAVGLGVSALRRGDASDAETQRRLRVMVEIIDMVEPRFGSAPLAYVWYRSEPLPGFSGRTAMRMVREGRREEVFEFIRAVDVGIHS